jgi:hypothetical protein
MESVGAQNCPYKYDVDQLPRKQQILFAADCIVDELKVRPEFPSQHGEMVREATQLALAVANGEYIRQKSLDELQVRILNALRKLSSATDYQSHELLRASASLLMSLKNEKSDIFHAVPTTMGSYSERQLRFQRQELNYLKSFKGTNVGATRPKRSKKSSQEKVGDVKKSAPGLTPQIQETIDRAYAYWTGESVGAKPPRKKARTNEQKAKRLEYLATLSQIRDFKRKAPVTISQLGILRDWQNDKSLTRLVQEVLGETPGYYNIIQLAEEATPEEFEHWIDWYQHAHEDVKSLQARHARIRRKQGEKPIPFDVVAAVVAVLSPNNSWLNNLAAADYLLTHQTGEGSTAYRANATKALTMMDTWVIDQVKGPKVTVFFESLHKPWATGHKVVLDGHMINIWRGQKRGIKGTKQPSVEERAQILRDFAQAAEDLSITPQSVQALTWYIWRYSTDKPAPYLKALKLARSEFMADLRAQHRAREEAERMADEFLREEEMFWGKDLDTVEGVGASRRAKPSMPSETSPPAHAPRKSSPAGLMLPSGKRI